MNRPMKQGRVLSKACFTKKKEIIIFGGNKDNANVERYDPKKEEWEMVDIAGINLVTQWKNLGYSSYTVNVQYQEPEFVPEPSPLKCRNTSYVFGTDDEPFLVEIDHNTFESRIEGCPMELRLKNYQGACRVNDTTIFIGGGINKELKTIFNTSYLINLQNKKVTICGNMEKLRYTFSCISMGVGDLLSPELRVCNRRQAVWK